MQGANAGDDILQLAHDLDTSATRLGSGLDNPQITGAVQVHLRPVRTHRLHCHLAAQVDCLPVKRELVDSVIQLYLLRVFYTFF